MPLLIAGLVMLAAGTYGFRLSGWVLRARVTFPPRVSRLLEAGTVVLLAALVAVTGLTAGHGFGGYARLAGVLVAGVLAWRKAPFIVIVVCAAAVTAVLRLAGAGLGCLQVDSPSPLTSPRDAAQPATPHKCRISGTVSTCP
jgi:branched-subunit amino acid transport protein